MLHNVPFVCAVPAHRKSLGLRQTGMWWSEACERSDLAERNPRHFSTDAHTILLYDVWAYLIISPNIFYSSILSNYHIFYY